MGFCFSLNFGPFDLVLEIKPVLSYMLCTHSVIELCHQPNFSFFRVHMYNIYVFTCVPCSAPLMYVCTCVDKRLTLWVFSCSSSHFWRQDLWMKSSLSEFYRLHADTAMFGFYMGSGDLSSGACVCMTGTLSTEPSP